MTEPLQLSNLIQVDDGKTKLDFTPSLSGLSGVKAAVLNSDLLKKTILNALSKALSVDVAPLLGSAWGAVDGVRTALEATRGDASATASIPLAAHQLKSSHTPSVTLMIDGCPPFDLAFGIDFILKLEGVELEIAEGRIVAVKSGGLSSHAVVKLAGQPLFEKASPRIDLPGRVPFATDTSTNASS